jgi:hypothetical protein
MPCIQVREIEEGIERETESERKYTWSQIEVREVLHIQKKENMKNR